LVRFSSSARTIAIVGAVAFAGAAETEQTLRAAVPALEQAYRVEPKNYANAWNLALAYFKLGEFDKAHTHIRDVLKARNTAELHNLLGAVQEKAGDNESAAREYETAARMEPSEKNLGDWAGFLIRRAALDAAMRIYRRGIELHPKSASLRIGLGLAYHGRGEYDEAVQWLCEAVDLDPGDPRPILFLGGLLDTSPKFAPQVTRRLENFVRLYPNNARAHLYYALSVWKEAETKGVPVNVPVVERHLKTAADLDAASFDAHLQLGILYEQAGRDADAIPVLAEAARLQPDSEAVHYRLARAYQRTGQQDLARKEFEKYRRVRGK
jgi:tetratricopeptide (TPR) repeat protein